MNDDKSFIKLHRKMLKWEWYSDINTKVLFIHLLLIANWEDKKWQGNLIKRGQVVTGRKKLSKETGLTEQQIRTSINKLISTNEITTDTTNKYTVITVVKYEDYQQKEEKSTNEITSNSTFEQPTNNQQVTTTKEYKEIKEYKEYISSCCIRVEELLGRTLNPSEVKIIIGWLEDDQYSEELIIEAIRLTVVNGKKYLTYTTGILHNWEDKGYKTLNDIREKERKKEEREEAKDIFYYDWLNDGDDTE